MPSRQVSEESGALILQLLGVHKQYPGKPNPLQAVEDITLELCKGRIAALMGPSGCGKTTLLRLAAGLEMPTRGKVVFAGREVDGPGPGRGIMFQEPRLFPWLTVKENVALGLPEQMESSEVSRSVDELLALVGVEGFGRAYPRELSGGMAQRVALARVLAVDPELLLLDEPFSGLDIANRFTLQEALGDIAAKRRLTVLMVTHDLDEALYLADTVYVLSHRPGRIAHQLELPIDRPRERVARKLQHYRSQLTEWLIAQAHR